MFSSLAANARKDMLIFLVRLVIRSAKVRMKSEQCLYTLRRRIHRSNVRQVMPLTSMTKKCQLKSAKGGMLFIFQILNSEGTGIIVR